MLIIPSGAALQIENELSITTAAADKSLQQLSSGSQINSGADDAAGLSIAAGLNANVAALNQSAQNVTDGIGLLQTADGALSQITSILDQSVTLATEAANGSVSDSQRQAIDSEFQAQLAEINNIAATTRYNGQSVFQLSLGVADRTIDNGSIFDSGNTLYGTATPKAGSLTVFTSDGTEDGSSTFVYTPLSVDARALGLTADHNQTASGESLDFAANLTLLTTTDAQAALTAITGAISQVAADRGTLDGMVDQLQAASSVDTTESQNLASASSDITSADIGATVANDSKYSVLEQTGISALQQSEAETRNIITLINN